MSVEFHQIQRQRIIDEIKRLRDERAVFPTTISNAGLDGLLDSCRVKGMSPALARPIFNRFFADLFQARIEELEAKLANPGAFACND